MRTCRTKSVLFIFCRQQLCWTGVWAAGAWFCDLFIYFCFSRDIMLRGRAGNFIFCLIPSGLAVSLFLPSNHEQILAHLFCVKNSRLFHSVWLLLDGKWGLKLKIKCFFYKLIYCAVDTSSGASALLKFESLYFNTKRDIQMFFVLHWSTSCSLQSSCVWWQELFTSGFDNALFWFFADPVQFCQVTSGQSFSGPLRVDSSGLQLGHSRTLRFDP